MMCKEIQELREIRKIWAQQLKTGRGCNLPFSAGVWFSWLVTAKNARGSNPFSENELYKIKISLISFLFNI